MRSYPRTLRHALVALVVSCNSLIGAVFVWYYGPVNPLITNVYAGWMVIGCIIAIIVFLLECFDVSRRAQ